MVHSSLLRVRKEYGGTYTSIFPDGFIVPWKPLSIGDYLKYDLDLRRGVILKEHLEDEVFVKCVLDVGVIRQINHLKAGIIPSVVQNIWEYSGPQNVDSFNQDLENARQLINLDSARVLHECVQLILNAFNYKPEEVYEMPYETFLIRLVQAEYKMIQAGILKEPISILSKDQKATVPQKGPRPSDPNQTFDAKKLWDEQREKNKPMVQPSQPKPQEMKKDKWWAVSPVLEGKAKHNIDFNLEQAEADTFGVSGHEKADIHLTRAKMVEDAQWIYKDLLDGLAKRKSKK